MGSLHVTYKNPGIARDPGAYWDHNAGFYWGSTIHILYLSELKPGSNTRRGSNIRRIVQQNERNKHLGPFKHQVPKLLNLINLKKVLNVKQN